MMHFLSFSLLLLSSFLFEQSVLLPFGLSPGGFFISFLVLCITLLFLGYEQRWWFLLFGGVVGGIFSVVPLFSFLVFACAGTLFLLVKPLVPVEHVFSYPVAVWLGTALYLFMSAFFWATGWLFGVSGMTSLSFLISFLASVVFFAFGVLAPVSVVWWLLLYRKRNNQSYMLR